MPIKLEMVQELLNDALQELVEINERKSHLDELVDKLRKCLPKQGLFDLSPPEPQAPRILASTKRVAKAGKRRKNSHATKTVEIVRESIEKLKIYDVIKAYSGKGWEISKSRENAYTTIYRAIKERPDLLRLTKDGYVKLAGQGHPSSEGVTP